MAQGETYEEFTEKFKPKKTTDDCYTPPLVYEAVKNWAINEYGWQGRAIVRPFYPGGDYENFDYPDNCVVIDNPPFSIISKIATFYSEHSIDYFLFAPYLTLFNVRAARSHICVGIHVVYDNGARINTSFVASQGAKIRSAPELYKAVKKAVEETQRNKVKQLPKYSYPNGVVTSTIVGQFSRYGVEYAEDNVFLIRQLDSQKASKKALFGTGYLVPRGKLAQAKKAQAKKAWAEKVRAEKVRTEKARATEWALSEREIGIIERLESGIN